MLLSEMAKKLNEYGLLCEVKGDVDIKYIAFDSRKVIADTLFVCKGVRFKDEYLTSAIEKGAVAYMSEKTFEADLPYIKVNDAGKAMSVVAMLFYGYPSRSFNTVGITGTKGKTTVAYFINNIFDEYTKSPNASITTIEVLTGGGKKNAVLTTPEAFDLQEIFAEARDNNVKFLTMEVSSQAVKSHRVFDMHYDVGVFLNIDDDHISPEEHPTWDDYFLCKLGLFKLSEVAVANADDEHSNEIIAEANKYCKTVYTYGRSEGADFKLTDVRRNGEYLDLDITTPDGTRETYTLAMHGGYNAENALCAITVAKHFGIDSDSIARGLKKTLVPGRMDMFYNRETDVTVVVDFAHNKLSYNKFFEALKEEYPDNRMVVVVGGDGGKAFQRRKAIGEMLNEFADVAVLTDCNSNFEDTYSICMDIMQYVDKENGPECIIILNREEAITATLRNAQKGDVVAIVAMGEEARRWWKGEVLDTVSDTELARRYCEGTL